MSRSAVLLRVVSAVCVLALIGTGIGLLAAPGSGPGKRHGIPQHRRALAFADADREADRGESADAERGGPASEQVGDRAWPRTYVETKRALIARQAVRSHPQRLARDDFRGGASPRAAALTTTWEELGPTTPDVPAVVTYTGRPTTISGRVTALVVSPTCVPLDCRVWVAAAGGGVWRTEDGLAATVAWTPVSSGIPSNAIGSLALDPNDATEQTIYAGTGEPNGSSDSEAGVGLYKSTDGGDHWALVPGSRAGVAQDRSVAGIAIDPADPTHILIGTALARHGSSAVNGGRRTPPGAPALGVWESINGGASFNLAFSRPGSGEDPATGLDFFRGGVNKLEIDPNHPSVVYVALFGYGVWRRGSTFDADTTNFHQVFAPAFPEDTFGARAEFALTDGPVAGTTRIYAGDTADDSPTADGSATLWRIDSADVASTAMTDGATNPGWTLLSDPLTAGGRTSDGFCQNAQCGYDVFVEVEPGHPDNVWLGGSMQYADLGGGASNGRAVVRSTDSGTNFHDMTNDTQSPPEGMHPDQHAIAFADVGGATVAFVGSDGGVVRVSGPYTADDSARCASPDLGLSPAAQATCEILLVDGPTTITSLNDGLATLQFQSLSVNPAAPATDIIGGTQDNGTWAWSGTSWFESVGGDGGQSLIDVANPAIRMHSYYSTSIDVNFQGTDPAGWIYISDPLDASGETASFYIPLIGDPAVSGTAFAGLSRVWRTKDDGGQPSQLDADHCEYTDPTPSTPAACGDWEPIGPDLTGVSFGTDRGGQYVVALARAPGDSDTLWAGTRTGRLFVTPNASAAGADVAFDRIDTTATPGRFVSGIVVDPADPHHAWISYSGYGAYTPDTPQHVVEAQFDPGTATATFTDRSYDLGDAPVTGLAVDSGDIYAATDFGVLRLPAGATAWTTAASGLPPVAVYGLTLDRGSHRLYAATHGRGAWRIQLPVPPAPPAPPTPPTETTPTSTTPTTTTPTDTTPEVTPPANSVSPAPFLVRRKLRRDAKRRAPVVLRCGAAGARCRGTLRLLAGLPAGGIVEVGRAPYSIPPGQRRTVRVVLHLRQFTSLRRAKRLHLTARALRKGSPYNVTLGSVVVLRR